MNKKLMVNLLCAITGGYFAWVVTDIHYLRKQRKELEKHNETVEILNNQVESLIGVTKYWRGQCEILEKHIKGTENEK